MNMGSLIVSLFVGLIGFALYRYGRSIRRAPPIAGGAAMMVYPYFVSGIGLTLVIGGAIIGVTWWALRLEL